MNSSPGSICKLDKAPIDQPLIIAATASDPVVAHRMMTLGWRVGGQVRVVKKAAGRATVVDLNGSRVAVSKALAHTLCVEAA